MSGRAVLLAALLLAGCGTGADGGDGAASCVGPQVALTPAEAVPGAPVTAEFELLHEGCDDHTGADEERAMVDVPVSFVQEGLDVPLGTVTGRGERWTATLEFAVPADSRPGGAAIRLGDAGGAVPGSFTVLPAG